MINGHEGKIWKPLPWMRRWGIIKKIFTASEMTNSMQFWKSRRYFYISINLRIWGTLKLKLQGGGFGLSYWKIYSFLLQFKMVWNGPEIESKYTDGCVGGLKYYVQMRNGCVLDLITVIDQESTGDRILTPAHLYALHWDWTIRVLASIF